MNEEDLVGWIRSHNETSRVECPMCANERRKTNKRDMQITLEGDSILYQCWHCGLSGKCSKDKAPVHKAAVTPISLPKSSNQDLISEYLLSRGIHFVDVSDYQLVTGKKYFHGEGELDAIGFVYGNKEAIKWRSIEGKRFTQDGAARTLWMPPKVSKDGYKTIIITEGEMDVLAIKSSLNDDMDALVVSVPNGAPQKVSNRKVDPSEDRKFGYLWDAKDLFEAAERVILAVDDDEPGDALAEEIQRRIGRAKCYRVQYPEGTKDANDVLLKCGSEILNEIVVDAAPVPLVGVYSANDYSDDVDFLYQKGLMGGLSTGFAGLDGIYSVLAGQLTVVTGQPGSGKSEWVDAVMVNLAKEHDWKFAVASFENPPPLHIIKLSEKYSGKPFFEGAHPRMNDDEMAESRNWVNDHFAFLDSKDGEAPTIDSIIDRTKQAVMRLGCRGLVVDPYNYISQSTNENEHQAISEMLTRMVTFARSHDLHIWFIAHPAKMRASDSGKFPIPNGNHISGSAAWFAKCDCGITVHRQDEHIEVHSWKSRFKWVGAVGMAELNYNFVNGRYSDRVHQTEQSRYSDAPSRSFQETESDWEF